MDVDVVIIGGGPAGSSAAISLLAADLSVAVIDSGPNRERPTEMAVPSLERNLKRLQAVSALGACEPCFGIASRWGISPKFQSSILDPAGHAWFIHRTEFDRELRRAVQAHGATWLQATAKEIKRSSEQVTVMGDEFSVVAKWGIFASGSHALAASITGQKPRIVDQLICYRGAMRSESKERVLATEPTDYGWWYVCPEAMGVVSACLVTDRLAAREVGAASLPKWTALLRATGLFVDLNMSGSARGLLVHDAGLSVLPRKCGHRWTAIGDSALRLDPLGSSGVTVALESGWKAAESISGAIGTGIVSSRVFQDWYDSLLTRFIRERAKQYSLEGKRRASNFWDRRTAADTRQSLSPETALT